MLVFIANKWRWVIYHCITAEGVDCADEIREFELESLYYAHLWTLKKRTNLMTHPSVS